MPCSDSSVADERYVCFQSISEGYRAERVLKDAPAVTGNRYSYLASTNQDIAVQPIRSDDRTKRNCSLFLNYRI